VDSWGTVRKAGGAKINVQTFNVIVLNSNVVVHP